MVDHCIASRSIEANIVSSLELVGCYVDPRDTGNTIQNCMIVVINFTIQSQDTTASDVTGLLIMLGERQSPQGDLETLRVEGRECQCRLQGRRQ
jgi:hypothetical protein